MKITAPTVFRFIAFACVLFFVIRVCQGIIYFKNAPPRKPDPGETEFTAANKTITVSNGNNACGNNSEAIALAQEYSKLMKKVTEEAFTGGKPGVLGEVSTKGQVPVYCLLNKDHCTIITQIPELRQYSGDALDALKKLAWLAAQAVAGKRSGGEGKEIELTVGLRGLIFYGPIMFGKTSGEPTSESEGMEGMKLLYPLFAPPGAQTTATGTGTSTLTSTSTPPQ